MQEELTVYIAGGLFNLGERARNARLATTLRRIGYTVIVPQEEALAFQGKDGTFDLEGVVEDCFATCTRPDVITIGCIDGPSADDGTAFELGGAVAATGRAIVWRTDFRTALDREVGMNAMFRKKGVTLIYHPCYVTEEKDFSLFYHELAVKIHAAISALPR